MSLVGRVILTGIICPQTPMGSYLVNVRYSPSAEEHMWRNTHTHTHPVRHIENRLSQF